MKLRDQIEYVRKRKLDRPCTDCSKMFHYTVMTFDHLPERGQKQFNPSGCGAKDKANYLCEAIDRSEAELDDELAKCELVCVCCHKMREYARAGDTKALEPSPDPCKICNEDFPAGASTLAQFRVDGRLYVERRCLNCHQYSVWRQQQLKWDKSR